MSRSDRDRLADVLDAIEAGRRDRGPLTGGLVFDAVGVRLIDIGEAVRPVEPDVSARQPPIPWRQVARMRDQLARRYVDPLYVVVDHTIHSDLQALEVPVRELVDEVGRTD